MEMAKRIDEKRDRCKADALSAFINVEAANSHDTGETKGLKKAAASARRSRVCRTLKEEEK
jgi:hypothetical protein